MDKHEKAFLSGLVFVNDKDKASPIWRPSSWPPLLGGNRIHHTSNVVHDPSSNHVKNVVILGGLMLEISADYTNSVILLNVHRTKWQEGPPMKERRINHASVVCNGAVYAIGGDNGSSYLDSIERINVEELIQHSSSSSTSSANGWTMLNCRLSMKRKGCAAAVVHDRFIVVAGGYNGNNYLSSVDILDTAFGNSCLVISGPSMEKYRCYFGMAVIGRRIYAVCGWRYSNSVEYLEFDDLLDKKANSATSVFPWSKSWTIHKDLRLKSCPGRHAVVRVGSCLVFAGDLTTNNSSEQSRSVQVLDVVKNVVWRLPDMRVTRSGCSMVSLLNGIAVIGGHVTLSLVDKNSWLFARLLAIGKVPTE